MSFLLLLSWLPTIMPGHTTADLIHHHLPLRTTSPNFPHIPRPIDVSVRQLSPLINQTFDGTVLPVIVMISWKMSHPKLHSKFIVSKFEVTYQPVNDKYRVIVEIPGDKRSVTLDHVFSNTYYKCTVSAVFINGKRRSNSVSVNFYTSKNKSSNENTLNQSKLPNAEDKSDDSERIETKLQLTVRNDEIIIVTGVLIFWVIVIIVFINKWGKIRMLEPYQPQYKQQFAPISPIALKNSRGELNHELSTERRVSRGNEVPKVMAQVHNYHLNRGQHRLRQSSMSVEHSFTKRIISRRSKSAENLCEYENLNVGFPM